MINKSSFEKVDSLVQSAVAAGASVVTGGHRADKDPGGFYYEPTVLAGCRQEMDVIQQEIFGPVAPVVTFDDLDQAIAYANDSEYGLTSSIYTRDLNTALRACQEIRFGETYINRENFEAMQGFHAGWRKSGIGGADWKARVVRVPADARGLHAARVRRGGAGRHNRRRRPQVVWKFTQHILHGCVSAGEGFDA